MAKKGKPFAVFETKEEFDHNFETIYDSGREHGYKEGLTTALSYIFGLIDDRFDDAQMQRNAEYEKKQRSISEWKQRQKIIEGAKKLAVDEFKKTLEGS